MPPETEDQSAESAKSEVAPVETDGEAASDAAAAVNSAPEAPEAKPKAPPKLGPGEELSDEVLKRQISTLLFASPDPVGLGRLQELLERPDRARLEGLLAALGEEFEASPFPIVIREIQGGYRLFTDPDMAEIVARLRATPKPEKISAAALETLAIVAYRQPVSKAEIEAIRGVQAGPMLRSLVDRGLVRVTGRADQPGSPLQYGTTRDFLDRFGLGKVKDLPRDAELAGD